MKRSILILSVLLIVLVACLLELATTTKAVQSSDMHTSGTVYSIPSHRQVCLLPSVENGYVETSSPVRCVNDPQRIATKQDIQAGIYAKPDALSQYEYWYATDASKIHHSQYPCFVIRVDGSLLCDPREYDGDLVEPTDAQLQDWQEYQISQGSGCIYLELDRCDGEQ